MADAVVLEISAVFASTVILELVKLCLKDSQLQKLARGRVSLLTFENNKVVKLFISPDKFPSLLKSMLKHKKNASQF